MIKLFGDFLSHSSLVDGFPILNKESFLLNKSAKEKEFLDKLVDSQNFSNLLQLDTEFLTYFNKLLKKKEENSKSKEKFDVKSLLSDKKIEYLENFLISPYFINEDIIRSDITRIEEVLFEKFKENLSLDKTVNRITGSQKEFTKLGVYKKYKRYIIPELRQPIQKTIKSRIDQILHKQKTVEYEGIITFKKKKNSIQKQI